MLAQASRLAWVGSRESGDERVEVGVDGARVISGACRRESGVRHLIQRCRTVGVRQLR